MLCTTGTHFTGMQYCVQIFSITQCIGDRLPRIYRIKTFRAHTGVYGLRRQQGQSTFWSAAIRDCQGRPPRQRCLGLQRRDHPFRFVCNVIVNCTSNTRWRILIPAPQTREHIPCHVVGGCGCCRLCGPVVVGGCGSRSNWRLTVLWASAGVLNIFNYSDNF